MAEIKDQEQPTLVHNLPEDTSKEIWEAANSKSIANSQKDIAWMTIHGCLPVRAFQHRRGLATSAECPREDCKGEEDIRHLLWSCPYARGVWKKMKGLIFRLTGQTNLTYENILHGTNLKCNYGKEETAWRVINCVKESLWASRNIGIYHHNPIEEKECIKLCFDKMTTYYYVDINKYGKTWAKGNWQTKSWSEYI